MSFEERIRSRLPAPGPYLAEITNNLDPTYMGGLEVALLKGVPNNFDKQSETYIVRYLNPFYGATSIRFEGANSGDFNDVQKSYGMWFVPPDIGTRIMVIFIDGDPNQGYWFGCVQETYQNHMIPGLAASRQVVLTPEQERKYGTDFLPVAEFNKLTLKLENSNFNRIGKPVHPFADRLLAQGLLLDTVRGVTSSSARRDAPSSVFGISTPGPLDTSPGAKRGQIGYDEKKSVPVSRLGGSTFVMDDGDKNGENELVRIRTRTGHQILLHNSQDLIYIANSKGTAWVELTSNGKIDIYARDSVSIHTEQDFNFRADRDINLEAGRNINIRSLGNMETNIAGHYFLIVDDNAKIAIKNDKEETIGQDLKLSVGQDTHLLTTNNTMFSTGKQFNIAAGGQYRETALEIHMNGPAATSAQAAALPPLLQTYSLPNRKISEGWANGNFYKSANITSIMQRVPTHEPWDQHENINPTKFSPPATDQGLQSRSASGVADNPAVGIQEPTNTPSVVPETCDPKFAKDINGSSAQQGIAVLKKACQDLGLTSSYAVASLLGISGGESRWKIVIENFNYTAARLLQVFPSVFKGDQTLAQKYAGNPNNTLPEFLYGYQTAKGKGLGNTLPGDGAKFIGRGYIQLTGRSNYTKYSQQMFDKGRVSSATALVDNPELLNDPKTAAEVSVLYMLDRVKLAQTDPGYFEAAYKAVGVGTPDIYISKKGYYECFLGQLQGGSIGTGTAGILVDSQGNPIKTGGEGSNK
jgi:predicted chitinase